MAIISQANIFIGVDSGFAHIANAAGIPSILLLGAFGPFKKHVPWLLGEHDIIIRSPNSSNNIRAASVIAAGKRFF
jgi:ADP-heptose:LPS heptosyltransferase